MAVGLNAITKLSTLQPPRRCFFIFNIHYFKRCLGMKDHKSSQTVGDRIIGHHQMETVTDPSLQAIPVSLRNLQSTAFQHPHPHPLTSQLSPEYEPNGFHNYGINDVQHVNGQVQAFAQPRQSLQTPIRYTNGSFGVITPDQQQQQPVSFQVNQDDSPSKEIGGHFSGMKAIANPHDLPQWREKLFNVNKMITLTEEEWVSSLCIEGPY
jgi:hypothetical protein